MIKSIFEKTAGVYIKCKNRPTSDAKKLDKWNLYKTIKQTLPYDMQNQIQENSGITDFHDQKTTTPDYQPQKWLEAACGYLIVTRQLSKLSCVPCKAKALADLFSDGRT